MKGFVITILSVSLIVILAILAISLRNTQLSTERALIAPLPLAYASFLSDDVAYELNSIVGPELSFNEKNDSMLIIIHDSIQSHNYSNEISTYDRFLKEEVASKTASNISTNFTNLNGGVITLFINEEYNYSNDHNADEVLFTRTNGTGATSYEINFTITAVRANVTHMAFDSNGTMNVTIHYTDLNGTGTEQGNVFPNQLNSMRVDYFGGSSIEVDVGLKNGNTGT